MKQGLTKRIIFLCIFSVFFFCVFGVLFSETDTKGLMIQSITESSNLDTSETQYEYDDQENLNRMVTTKFTQYSNSHEDYNHQLSEKMTYEYNDADRLIHEKHTIFNKYQGFEPGWPNNETYLDIIREYNSNGDIVKEIETKKYRQDMGFKEGEYVVFKTESGYKYNKDKTLNSISVIIDIESPFGTYEPITEVTNYEYDEQGFLIRKTAKNTQVNYAYDARGNRIGEYLLGAFEATNITREFDAAGNLIKQKKYTNIEMGVTITETLYVYDESNNLIEESSTVSSGIDGQSIDDMDTVRSRTVYIYASAGE